MNFLITCVGAYGDSGIGTGGLVLVNQDKNYVIDKFDSTGLFRKGNSYFRFIREKRTLVGYNENGVFYQCKFPEVKDCHDIYIEDDYIFLVSTSTNQIFKYNFSGRLIFIKHLAGIGDAWHINCLEKKEDKFYLTAFGQFSTHREWNEKGCFEKGILYDLNSDKVVLTGLSGPHHPRFIDEKWFICDSHKNSLKVYNKDKLVTEIVLNGFTRGVTYDENFIYIGVSANRKSANSLNSNIIVLDRRQLNIVKHISVSFPEIYDIVVCDDLTCKSIISNINNFKIFEENDNTVGLIKQVEIIHKSYIELEEKFEKLKKQKNIFQKIKTKFKLK